MHRNNPSHPLLNGDGPAAGDDSQLLGGLFYTPAGVSRFVKELVDGSASRGYEPTCGAGCLFADTERSVNIAASGFGIFTH
jgi:hypothetical protein